jgi:hypothetical protein
MDSEISRSRMKGRERGEIRRRMEMDRMRERTTNLTLCNCKPVLSYCLKAITESWFSTLRAKAASLGIVYKTGGKNYRLENKFRSNL